MPKRAITIQLDPDLIEEIDQARGEQARQEWIAVACRRKLDEGPPLGMAIDLMPGTRASYRQGYGPNVENIRSSSQAKRDVKPIPKRKDG